MNIKIIKCGTGEQTILDGYMEYAEGESRQEKKPALYIAVRGKDSEYEIHLYANTKDEFEKLINDLKRIKDSFPQRYKS